MPDEIKSGFYYKGEKIEDIILTKREYSDVNMDGSNKTVELLNFTDNDIIPINSESYNSGYITNEPFTYLKREKKDDENKYQQNFANKYIDGYKFQNKDFMIDKKSAAVPSIYGEQLFYRESSGSYTLYLSNNILQITDNSTNEIFTYNYESPFIYLFTSNKGNNADNGISAYSYGSGVSPSNYYYYCNGNRPGTSGDVYFYLLNNNEYYNIHLNTEENFVIDNADKNRYPGMSRSSYNIGFYPNTESFQAQSSFSFNLETQDLLWEKLFKVCSLLGSKIINKFTINGNVTESFTDNFKYGKTLSIHFPKVDLEAINYFQNFTYIDKNEKSSVPACGKGQKVIYGGTHTYKWYTKKETFNVTYKPFYSKTGTIKLNLTSARHPFF